MGLRTEKKWGAKRLIKQFQNKRWSLRSVNRLLNKIDNFGTTKRKSGSGRRRSVRTQRLTFWWLRIWYAAKTMFLIVTKAPGRWHVNWYLSLICCTHRTNDLKLKAFKWLVVQKLDTTCKVKRLQRCQQLLARFPTDKSVRSIWLSLWMKDVYGRFPIKQSKWLCVCWRQSKKGHSHRLTHSSTGTFQSQHHGFSRSVTNWEDKCGLRRCWRKDQ